jgi:hypothetical protein
MRLLSCGAATMLGTTVHSRAKEMRRVKFEISHPPLDVRVTTARQS